MLRAAVVATALALALAAPASADQLVFDCGNAFENLCRARPDGTGLQPLTSDGAPGTDRVYGSPALTRDGRLLAYVFATDVFLRPLAGGAPLHATAQFLPAVIRFRGDGLRFAVAEATATGRPGNQLCTYNSDLSGTNEGRLCAAGGLSSGMDYLPDGRMIMSASGGTATGGRTVIFLVLAEGGPSGTERVLVNDPAANLESPATSPDGRFVAAVRAPLSGGTTGDIAIYDLGTGALVRQLTSGGGAAAPVFSNDGRQVAFDRGGAVWVTSASGAPGGERRVVDNGRTVTWGGGTIPAAFTRLSIARRQRGNRVRGRLTIAQSGSTVAIELRSGGRRVGRLTKRSVRKGTFRFAVRLTRRVRRVTVNVAVTPPGAGPDRATRTVTIRR